MKTIKGDLILTEDTQNLPSTNKNNNVKGKTPATQPKRHDICTCGHSEKFHKDRTRYCLYTDLSKKSRLFCKCCEFIPSTQQDVTPAEPSQEDNQDIREAISLNGQQQADYILNMLKIAKKEGYETALNDVKEIIEKWGVKFNISKWIEYDDLLNKIGELNDILH